MGIRTRKPLPKGPSEGCAIGGQGLQRPARTAEPASFLHATTTFFAHPGEAAHTYPPLPSTPPPPPDQALGTWRQSGRK